MNSKLSTKGITNPVANSREALALSHKIWQVSETFAEEKLGNPSSYWWFDNWANSSGNDGLRVIRIRWVKEVSQDIINQWQQFVTPLLADYAGSFQFYTTPHVWAGQYIRKTSMRNFNLRIWYKSELKFARKGPNPKYHSNGFITFIPESEWEEHIRIVF